MKQLVLVVASVGICACNGGGGATAIDGSVDSAPTDAAPVDQAIDGHVDAHVDAPTDSPVDVAVDAPAGPLTRVAYIKASNTGAYDQFSRVAISADGNTLVVGAYYEQSAATVVNGDQFDDSAPEAGAAYVFTRVGGTWQQQAYLKAFNSTTDDEFGGAVAISADGTTIAVGARNEDSSAVFSGAVYIFTRTGTTWSQQAMLKAPSADPQDGFGETVAISANGNRVVVGAPREDSAATTIDGDANDDSAAQSGAAYVFQRTGSTWAHTTYLKPANSRGNAGFGNRVAISGDGGTVVIAALREASSSIGVDQVPTTYLTAVSGAAYVFTSNGSTWTQSNYLKASNPGASDNFGESVAISADGSTIAIGATNEDSSSTGINGDQTDNSQSSSGAVYVFIRSGASWTQQAYVKASNTEAGDRFGGEISLSATGDRLAVGAVDEASAATGIDGDQASNGASDSGAVYLFARTGAIWTHDHYVKSPTTQADDAFGSGVTLSGDGATLVVGAVGEHGTGRGIDPPVTLGPYQTGAVYVIE